MLIVICSGCLGKSDEELIRDRMNAFLTAYNSGDLQGVLHCMDAKTRNTYQSALNIGNVLVGLSGVSIGLEDLFGLGVGLMTEGDLLEFENMEISIRSDTKATVTVTMSYNEPGASYSEDVRFTLVKENGDWFIKN